MNKIQSIDTIEKEYNELIKKLINIGFYKNENSHYIYKKNNHMMDIGFAYHIAHLNYTSNILIYSNFNGHFRRDRILLNNDTFNKINYIIENPNILQYNEI